VKKAASGNNPLRPKAETAHLGTSKGSALPREARLAGRLKDEVCPFMEAVVLKTS